MKRKVLACLMPVLLISGAVNAAEVYNKNGNKLDIYGKVQGLHYFSDNPGDDGDQSVARIGVKGETQISDLLTGYGQWEYQMKASKQEGKDDARVRLAFAGLKLAEYGSLDYGRNNGVMKDIESFTDVLPEYGGDTYTFTDVYMTGRASSLVTYRNNDFFGLVDGLNFTLQYQGNNESSKGGNEGTANNNAANNDGTDSSNSRSLHKENGDGFGMSASYGFDFGLSLGAAWSGSDRTNRQVLNGEGGYDSEDAGGNKAEAWTIGVKYDANDIYLATMYAETRNMTPYGDNYIANKTQNVEIVAQYLFDIGLQPSVAYLQSKGKELGGYAPGKYVDKDLVKYVEIGATYYFNKNMNVYVDYKVNLLDEDDTFYKERGIPTDDIFAVSLTYRF